MRVLVLFFVLLSISGFSRNTGDTLLPRNSLCIGVAGRFVEGIGFNYEFILAKKKLNNYPKVFTSLEANLGYAGYIFVISGIGISRNWSLMKNHRMYFNVGVIGSGLIALPPTPKYIREMYKNTSNIPVEVLHPIEPWLFGNFGMRYFFHRYFIQLSFTPFLFYDRVYKHRFYESPWGEISFGINFN